MNKTIIGLSDLKPGDIFLCVFEHPSPNAYFEALINLIKYYNSKDETEHKKFMENALVILRGLIITFDDDIYTHAAFWNGEAVVEAGLSGVKANLIDHYKATITDVYRFTKNGKELGSEEFPTLQLVEMAQSLVDQNLSYSYETAYLYILLCFSRWKRQEWIRKMKNFLKAHLSANSSSYIELIFNAYHDKIVMLFEWMADEMIRQIIAYKKDDGLVCSETVAKIYNEATPVGKYHIEKPLTLNLNNDQDIPELKNSQMDKNTLDKLIDSLENMKIMTSQKFDSASWERVVDIEYTPHDLARSKNTYLTGRLDLGS